MPQILISIFCDLVQPSLFVVLQERYYNKQHADAPNRDKRRVRFLYVCGCVTGTAPKKMYIPVVHVFNVVVIDT